MGDAHGATFYKCLEEFNYTTTNMKDSASIDNSDCEDDDTSVEVGEKAETCFNTCASLHLIDLNDTATCDMSNDDGGDDDMAIFMDSDMSCCMLEECTDIDDDTATDMLDFFEYY